MAIYLIIPLAFLVILVDTFFLNKFLLNNYLHFSPVSFAIWTLIFGLPHIVGGLITMADKEYLVHYKNQLFFSIPLIVLFVILAPKAFGEDLFILIFWAATMYHVIAQQLGLAMMMAEGKRGAHFLLWKITCVTVGFLGFYMINNDLLNWEYQIIGGKYYNRCFFLMLFIYGCSCYFFFRILKGAKTQLGVLNLWANQIMIGSALISIHTYYFSFVIIILRVIHDYTAFFIYTAHECNRNTENHKKLIYKLFQRGPLFNGVLFLILSFLLASLIDFKGNKVVVTIAFSVSFLHYYLEGFIWKGPNPHRKKIYFLKS